MKRFMTLTVLLALGLLLSLYATTIQVGELDFPDGNLPVHGSSHYHYSQQIYPQSLINFEGSICRIGFYLTDGNWDDLENSHNWTIYLGHVARNSFGNPSDWVPVAELSQVYSGSIFSDCSLDGNWIEIHLQTPFYYNNVDNLVVAVHENSPGASNSLYWGSFYAEYLPSGRFAGLAAVSLNNIDLSDPYLTGYISFSIPTLRLKFASVEAPLPPVPTYPLNNATLTNGEYLEWTLPYGSPHANVYEVYIDDTLYDGQAWAECQLQGLSAGPHTWYVIAKNQAGSSAPSPTHTFNVASTVVIGYDFEDCGLPIQRTSNYNYSQSIFLQSEIGINNQGNDAANCYIDKIAFFWDGASSAWDSNDWVVYMGHTNKTQFSSPSDWVPVGEMTQVFAGHVNLFAIDGWVEILLDTPFLYNTTSNIVIAVDENTPGSDHYGNPSFHNTQTLGQQRSIAYHGDDNPHPSAPPPGTLVSAIPNILLHIGALQTTPLLSAAPNALDFGIVLNGEIGQTLDVTVSNVGIGTLNLAASDVSIIGPNADEFSFDPAQLPVSLTQGESATIPISLNSATSGPISATLRIVYNGQNHDVSLIAIVTPAGSIVIGNGDQVQQYPFPAEHRSSYTATLYKAHEINGAGKLQMIAWDCAEVNSYNYELFYKIWAKNTQDDFMNYTTWEDLRADMTLLKEGWFIPSTGGWQMFQIDAPFLYTGANLIVYVETQISQGCLESQRQWFNYTDFGEKRSLTTNMPQPPTGYEQLNNRVPNLMLLLVPDMEADLAAIKLSGPLAPTVGELSHYSVRVRNNGSDTQSNYQVKLLDADSNMLAVVNGPAVSSGEIVEVSIPWTPSTAGQTSIRAKVQIQDDSFGDNDLTQALQIDVLPAAMHASTIGEHNYLSQVPLNFKARSSIYETIYHADELGFSSGTITSLVIYNRFFDSLSAKPTQVFLGHTDLQNLSGGITPATQLTQVFAGLVDFPAGENNIVIHFQTPFVYTGGNLAMLFYRPLDEEVCALPNHFKTQVVGDNRARHYSGDDAINLDFPPHGYVITSRPITSFIYNPELLQNDLGAYALSGNPTPVIGVASHYTVRIRNNGVITQDNYALKLIDSSGVELTSVAGPSIEALQSLDVYIPWMPPTCGSFSFYAKVLLDGDAFEVNDCTQSIEVRAYPPGAQEVAATLAEDLELSWTAVAESPMEFSGYLVYRLHPDQVMDEAAWHPVTPEPISSTSTLDPHWSLLPSGNYIWAVKAVYSDDLLSLPSFSNTLACDTPSGLVTGVVKSRYHVPIAGARISNGIVFTTTNASGIYSLPVPAGTHSLTASAQDYYSLTLEAIAVSEGQSTTADFILLSSTPADDPQNPVVATALHGNYPNPFNPETTISYSLKEAGPVRIEIYNLKGQLVRTLVNEAKDCGNHTAIWNGRDQYNRSVSSGVYLFKMISGRYSSTRKMIMMK